MSKEPLPSLELKWKALELDESDLKLYAPIGRLIFHVAKLEFELDQYFFLFQEKLPKIAQVLAPKFPDKYEGKRDLFVNTFAEHPPLQHIGDANGELDWDEIKLVFDKLFEARNHLAHGAIYHSRTKDKRIVFRAKKYSRVGKQRFQKVEYEFSDVFLERMYESCLYLKALVRNASALLNGEDIETELNKLRQNRLKYLELIKQFDTKSEIEE